jgi:uncharacterized protein (DUF111 family)
MNPELYDYIFEKAFEIGALDVYTTPVLMKKNRPGIVLSVLTPPERKDQIMRFILKETTTLGLRWQEMPRAKARREIQTVTTSYGQVRVKVSRIGKEITHVAPEYDDCKKLAQLHSDVPLKRIYQEALRQYN